MTAPSIITRMHDYGGSFYILVRRGGAFVIERPEEQDPPRDPPETVLRLFLSVEDATTYRERRGSEKNASIGKVTILGLWGILEKLTEVSQKDFECPVAVEVSAVDLRGEIVTVDTLHSLHSLPA